MIDDSWSQGHSLGIADINGDGRPDLITGKRYMAHNGRDPGEREPLGIYWYEMMKPAAGGVEWVKHVIDYGGRARWWRHAGDGGQGGGARVPAGTGEWAGSRGCSYFHRAGRGAEVEYQAQGEIN
jgi:hypothetical protein